MDYRHAEWPQGPEWLNTYHDQQVIRTRANECQATDSEINLEMFLVCGFELIHTWS